MQSSSRRSTKVCTRCRKRKKKCDFNFPACSSCQASKAVCLGYDPVTREAVPRSLVKSLEARVAELETEMLAYRAAPENIPFSMASRIAQASLSFAIPPLDSQFRSKISLVLLFRPSYPPLAVLRDRWKETAPTQTPSSSHNDDLFSPSDYNRYTSSRLINLGSVPFSAVQRMMQNYIDIHLPQYPCVDEKLLESIVERIRNANLGETNPFSIDYSVSPAASGLGHYEYCLLFIILALSAMTLTWRADHQARAASETFFNSALKHLQALQGHDQIQILQISLLLAHYANMCPERADNWTSIANAVRIVLDLGLHKGCPKTLSAEEVRRRNQLFWVTYGMDRALCANLRLPLSFPEESITTPLDTSSDDIFYSLSVNPDVEKRTSAKHIYLYRALETEVHRVLHLEEDLERFGHQTIDSWIADISGRLQVWYKKAQSYTQYNMLEFQHVQFNHLRARIHRPTPRLRTRTPEDRRIVLESTLVLIEDYMGQEHRRRLFYPWHGVHILFEAAVIALEACWSSYDWEPIWSAVLNMVNISIPQCVQLLTNIGQRWAPAGACADRLTPLVQKISAVFAQARSDSFELQRDAAITEEIQVLLFPDGPLTWNQPPPPQDALWGFEDNSAFADSAFFENMEFFQWNPEWGIVPAESV